jgi:hypothetical protein
VWGPSLSPPVAGRPLRPATDRRLGGPSPRQLANRTQPPPAAPPRRAAFLGRPTGGRAHAVLAPVSRRYPPPRGRSVTRSAPVRHWPPPEGWPVRLACVRHAASVDPEPGSNSPPEPHGQHAPTRRRRGLRCFASPRLCAPHQGRRRAGTAHRADTTPGRARPTLHLLNVPPPTYRDTAYPWRSARGDFSISFGLEKPNEAETSMPYVLAICLSGGEIAALEPSRFSGAK